MTPAEKQVETKIAKPGAIGAAHHPAAH